jgi:hypothetical protein
MRLLLLGSIVFVRLVTVITTPSMAEKTDGLGQASQVTGCPHPRDFLTKTFHRTLRQHPATVNSEAQQ